MRFLMMIAVAGFAPPVMAQDIAEFGAWRAVCAPTAGCALGTQTDAGDHLTFTEPPAEESKLLFFPKAAPSDTSVVLISFEDDDRTVLDANTGWRMAQTEAGEAIEFAPNVVAQTFGPKMLTAEEMTIRYMVSERRQAEVVFSLIGYSDARGYADGE